MEMKAQYKELMTSADQDIFEWLMGRKVSDAALTPIVTAIRDYKRTVRKGY
jgi:succinate dehydrogenase flavin-adding protein (antitoxin of CptAB toxin-antitoxin module)